MGSLIALICIIRWIWINSSSMTFDRVSNVILELLSAVIIALMTLSGETSKSGSSCDVVGDLNIWAQWLTSEVCANANSAPFVY
jgi:hypothetical protein